MWPVCARHLLTIISYLYYIAENCLWLYNCKVEAGNKIILAEMCGCNSSPCLSECIPFSLISWSKQSIVYIFIVIIIQHPVYATIIMYCICILIWTWQSPSLYCFVCIHILVQHPHTIWISNSSLSATFKFELVIYNPHYYVLHWLKLFNFVLTVTQKLDFESGAVVYCTCSYSVYFIQQALYIYRLPVGSFKDSNFNHLCG